MSPVNGFSTSVVVSIDTTDSTVFTTLSPGTPFVRLVFYEHARLAASATGTAGIHAAAVRDVTLSTSSPVNITIGGLDPGTEYHVESTAMVTDAFVCQLQPATAVGSTHGEPLFTYPAVVGAATLSALSVTPTVPASAGAGHSWTALGSLPPGLALDSSTGAISGTTTAQNGVYTLYIRAQFPGGSYMHRVVVSVQGRSAPLSHSLPHHNH